MGHSAGHTGPTPPAAFSDLDGTNGFAVHGLDEGDILGVMVSGAGDVNGDGFDDLLIPAPGGDPNAFREAGEIYVIFGKISSYPAIFDQTTLDGTNGFQINGSNTLDALGAVSDAGDVNSDGFGDIIVAAPAASPDGISAAGESYVMFGTGQGFAASFEPTALDGSNGFRINGIDAEDNSGAFVSGAGDVNGDGFGDVIINARGADPAGETYVVFGTSQVLAPSLDLSVLDGVNGFRFDAGTIFSFSEDRIGDVGDINGDGFDDFMVGGSITYVVFGTGLGFPPNLSPATLGNGGFQIISSIGASFGHSASGAGDVNGDGLADLMISASNTAALDGHVYVVYGTIQGFPASLDVADLDGGNGVRIEGAEGDRIGFSLSKAGDVNSDGIDDLLIGKAQPRAGDDYMYVIYGDGQRTEPIFSLTLLDGSGGFRIESTDASDDGNLLTVSDAGDVNGDGFDDIVIGSLFARPDDIPFAGKAFTVFGGDFTGSVTKAGGAGNDTLVGTSGGDVMVAGPGNDMLRGKGGPDVLKGGAGDDVMSVTDATFKRLDGGGGSDTLVVEGFDLDLTAIPDLRVSDIENIDLSDGATNQVTLALRDLHNLSDTANTITITGDNGDRVVVDLTGTGFQPSNPGNGFIAYTADPATDAMTLLVQDSLDVSGILF